ncbi:histidine kinase [Methylobacterium currus]|uniref:histidine kinase n=1 Tax=Methylobacterium currus TaxID=2051553 RepID=A0A2R4WQD2_9HYPH|nr:HWE histidine kinase domain-containing protein [Methylobacterium currus]AWB23738.1 histidine kinase [Methylobacterium currus]
MTRITHSRRFAKGRADCYRSVVRPYEPSGNHTPLSRMIDPQCGAEVERSAALHAYKLLDAPREQDFDDIARMASRICGTPMAVVNLVDTHRQFFLAEVGLGVRETPLETSFCGHAILEEDLLVIPDARQDPRFDGNPLVHGTAGLQFYAGAVLKTPDGQPIGTMCVLDTKPRHLSELQIDMLRFLARQAMTQMELRRSVATRDRLLAEARAAEARRRDLAHEMAHRMKNLLSMVQAVATQTLRQATSMEEGRLAISHRLTALARAQDILLQADFKAADVCEVVAATIAPHQTSDRRIRLNGPGTLLTSQQALGLSLAVHELATNAAKYGALSNDDGTVDVAWTDEDNAFVFDWTERGGPAVVAPDRRGFGSKLIERIVASYFNGEGRIDFAPEGIRFRLVGKSDRLPVTA